ncbi:hypothetical protein FRC02_004855 [Tulasnella sp. 418]|nr:hypothetical protein FRC02_004855 [Tulasnella sp. 418]
MLVYSDGSMIETEHGRKTGYSFVAYFQGETIVERSRCLGAMAEVYDAELMGLASAAEYTIPLPYKPQTTTSPPSTQSTSMRTTTLPSQESSRMPRYPARQYPHDLGTQYSHS